MSGGRSGRCVGTEGVIAGRARAGGCGCVVVLAVWCWLEDYSRVVVLVYYHAREGGMYEVVGGL